MMLTRVLTAAALIALAAAPQHAPHDLPKLNLALQALDLRDRAMGRLRAIKADISTARLARSGRELAFSPPIASKNAAAPQ